MFHHYKFAVTGGEEIETPDHLDCDSSSVYDIWDQTRSLLIEFGRRDWSFPFLCIDCKPNKPGNQNEGAIW